MKPFKNNNKEKDDEFTDEDLYGDDDLNDEELEEKENGK